MQALCMPESVTEAPLSVLHVAAEYWLARSAIQYNTFRAMSMQKQH